MAGPIAAALYFCTPIVAVAGTSAFNDAALVYFSLAAVLLAMEDEPLFAGILAGFCYAVKMTGFVAVPAALAFFLWRRQWRSAAICGTAAALVLSPWLIRNWVQTGNPFAPFLQRVVPKSIFLSQHRADSCRRVCAITACPSGGDFRSFWPGSRLQGIIGPAFVLSPLALLARVVRAGCC